MCIDDIFWEPRIRVNREHTIPAEYKQLKNTGHIDVYKLDWKPGKEPKPLFFWDSDTVKWIEAASYILAINPDPKLDSLVDDVIDRIVSIQQPDGYINSYYSQVEPDKRWLNLRDNHELYSAGHMIEAAVAHYQATGKRKFLDAVIRYADYIDSIFGVEDGKMRGYCGHEEIELALVRLYHATGDEKYLKLGQYFVDERGRQPYYFDIEAKLREENPEDFWAKTYKYCQAHIPAREQTEVVGHAVRAMYLYSAMADLAYELNDPKLTGTLKKLWNDLTLKKMYITGGIGPSADNEGFTKNYDLPNLTAYAETCAAIGMVFWAHRMLMLECDSRYSDVMERALYNGVISSVSLDGKRFFYENPLAGNGNHHRQDWFICPCCPPNIARLLASLGQYVYSQATDGIAVHLYVKGSAAAVLPDGSPITLYQNTRYPWDGDIKLTMEMEAPAEFTLRLRIPDWCRNYILKINGTLIDYVSIEKGYAILSREWQPSDEVELLLAMPVEKMAANPNVMNNYGRVALQRGPLVYCLEGIDNPVDINSIAIPRDTKFHGYFDTTRLNGIVVIEGVAAAIDYTPWDGKLYNHYKPLPAFPVTIHAIPYYAWDNRDACDMLVWLPIF